ncbi:phosphotransferase family protein [Georgenia alba]|uniref:Phosphotransferase family protein n=1 Tax=Georgenia alba TaxID=2233858 RepID=A0ABW2QH16_9MICO
MSVPAAAQREPADVAMLTSAEAGGMLAGALEGDGSRLLDWQVHTVHHRPGAGVTVGYTATVERFAGAGAAPVRAEEYLCATTARLSRPTTPGLVRFPAPGGRAVHLWRHPADPELPGLPVACDAGRLSERLGAQVGVELLAYRPTRRAVLRVTRVERTGDADATAYLKVVRPAVYGTFVERHRMLTAAGVPAPRVLRADDDGLVLLETGRGTPLANLLAHGPGERSGTVLAALVATLDTLPEQVLELPRRPSWSDRVDHYAHAAATVLPEHVERTRLLAQGVSELMASSDPGPVVPTHGDFYEANVLMDAATDSVASLLDVDAVGPGHRVDDLACLLGHVSVLPHLAPQTYPHVPSVLQEWTDACSRVVDPVALNARCAGVVLSLVAGARRTDGAHWRSDAEGRLARAETWLAHGRELLARRGPR